MRIPRLFEKSAGIIRDTVNFRGTPIISSLTEQLGQDIRSMLAVDVPLAFEEETSKTLSESLTVSYLRSYSVTCDLPPQTAITSIEARAVY